MERTFPSFGSYDISEFPFSILSAVSSLQTLRTELLQGSLITPLLLSTYTLSPRELSQTYRFKCYLYVNNSQMSPSSQDGSPDLQTCICNYLTFPPGLQRSISSFMCPKLSSNTLSICARLSPFLIIYSSSYSNQNPRSPSCFSLSLTAYTHSARKYFELDLQNTTTANTLSKPSPPPT